MSCPQIKTWAFPRHSARHSRADGNPVNIRHHYSCLDLVSPCTASTFFSKRRYEENLSPDIVSYGYPRHSVRHSRADGNPDLPSRHTGECQYPVYFKYLHSL